MLKTGKTRVPLRPGERRISQNRSAGKTGSDKRQPCCHRLGRLGVHSCDGNSDFRPCGLARLGRLEVPTATALTLVVDNQRVNGKVRQHVPCRLGRLDVLLASGQLDALLHTLGRFSDKYTILGAHANGESLTTRTLYDQNIHLTREGEMMLVLALIHHKVNVV